MSQQQPPSLPHYRGLAARSGYEIALREAAADVDNLTDQLGRKLDLQRLLNVIPYLVGALVTLAAVYLMACGTMHEEAPYDWPKLTTEIHRVSFFDVQRHCSKYLSPLAWLWSMGLTNGCAEVNFQTKRCDIWIPQGEVPEDVLEHELEHCGGHDHLEDTTLRDAWNNWKANGGR